MTDKDFLLNAYAAQYGPEAGPWNLGVVNKYLEYRFADFFQTHFPVPEGGNICNIGIGAGAWDRFLSYQLRGGSLTSIDRDEVCCRQLREGLCIEQNPNPVQVLCADVLTLELPRQFSIVTVVGSTLEESGQGVSLLEKAASFLKQGGGLYLQLLNRAGEDLLIRTLREKGLILGHRLAEDSYGLPCGYYRFEKT